MHASPDAVTGEQRNAATQAMLGYCAEVHAAKMASPGDDLAFGGHGPHYCLGSHFARIQAAAMLREIVTQLPGLFLAGEPAWLASSMISGPSRVPVSFAPSPRRAA
jgi:cytochrome P450